MPRKDPITGCNVMTQAEFWAAEAKREGKTVPEVLDEHYEQLQEEHDRITAHYHQHEVALKFLQGLANDEKAAWLDNKEYYEGRGETFDELPIPIPVKVLSINKVNVKESFRESSVYIQARCECDIGTYTIKGGTSYWSGSFYEPPDQDSTFEFVQETT